MREILFRGKRRDNGEWIVGQLIRYEGGRARIVEAGENIFCYEMDISIIQTVAHHVNPSTVGQYTGLTDKNGKKIFEGDIVTFPWGGLGLYHFVMRWNDCCAKFCAFPVKESADVWPIELFGYEEQTEVIGNIHDNPELLEVSCETD